MRKASAALFFAQMMQQSNANQDKAKRMRLQYQDKQIEYVKHFPAVTMK